MYSVRVDTDGGFDWAQWDRFVAECPGGTFYHSSAWLKALAEGLGADIRVHMLLEAGRLRAGAFVRRAARYGLCAGRKPWATGYNGVISSDPSGEAAARLRQALLREYQQVRLVDAPDGACLTDGPAPWIATSRVTPIIDMSDLDRLWQSFDRRARQRVRKAQSLGVTACQSEDFNLFAQLYKMTYVRQGLPMQLESAAIAKLLSIAVKSGGARLFIAKTSAGDAAAGLFAGLLPLDAESRGRRVGAWFVLAASHPVHRKTDAVSLLWWHAMQKCADAAARLDLVGHGVTTIDQFKRSFSPTFQPHCERSAYGNRPAAWALRAVNFLRGIKKEGQT